MSTATLAEGYTIHGRVFGEDFTNTVYFISDYSLEENIHNLIYAYFEGNYSCDCNKAKFAGIEGEDGHPCGDSAEYEKLELVKDADVVADLLAIYKERY